jgi:hypothetical protein
MREAYSLVWSVLVLLFRSRVSLEAEILMLRHQLNIQRRHAPKRVAFSAMDRLIFVGLYRLVPNTIQALTIVKPDTVVRWHRAGFRSYWRWKSRHRCGRPTVLLEIRGLIREMSIANPLWGAPRIHGELLKLGIEIGQTSVAKYMARRSGPPSQGWKTFLRNHAARAAVCQAAPAIPQASAVESHQPSPTTMEDRSFRRVRTLVTQKAPTRPIR